MEVLQGLATERAQPVILARRSGARFSPFGLDQAFPAEPAEQWVDRSLGDQNPAWSGKLLNQLEAVVWPSLEQCQHAVLDHAASELGAKSIRIHARMIPTGTLYCKVPV